jgi:hypothetical protein
MGWKFITVKNPLKPRVLSVKAMSPKNIALPQIETAQETPDKGGDVPWYENPKSPFYIALIVLVLIAVILILLIIYLRSQK